ncbi:MAG: hypothetical protein IJS09_07785 [Treponema sp.]|nr:hypothetical protein [Treponema sp.]
MPNNDIRIALKRYGIFFGIAFGISAVLFCFIILAHNSWKQGLSQTVQSTLSYYYPDSYTVGEFLEVQSALSTSSAVFTLKTKKANVKELSIFCVLVRIPTQIGAQPALFLYSPVHGVQFVGYALDSGKAERILNADVNKSIIAYWRDQVPVILEKAGVL